MENRILIDPNLLYLLVLFGGIATTLLGGGGIAAVILFMRSKSKEADRAWNALPPDVQKVITPIIQGAAEVVGQVAQLVQILKDWTDGDPNTPPPDPVEDGLAQVGKLASSQAYMNPAQVQRLETYTRMLQDRAEQLKFPIEGDSKASG